MKCLVVKVSYTIFTEGNLNTSCVERVGIRDQGECYVSVSVIVLKNLITDRKSDQTFEILLGPRVMSTLSQIVYRP